MPLQATSGAASYDGFGGGPAAVPNYIEDVFSTWLYTGNGSTQTITNGIDLSGKGGLVWIKQRNGTGSNNVFDTNRGAGNALITNATSASSTDSAFSSFTSSGFSLNGLSYQINESGSTYASWTFREQPKFFDVVTYTGDGVTNRAVTHSLGSTPGCIIVKRTDTATDWYVYHRSSNSAWTGGTTAGVTTGGNATGQLKLNQTGAFNAFGGVFTYINSTAFGVNFDDNSLNVNGATYVAYIFAHDAGGFGLTGTDNVISCGSYTGTGSPLSVTLGYEPQWILVKRATGGTNNWVLMDTMRGMSLTQASWLYPNVSDAEVDAGAQCNPTATGFTITSTGTNLNAGGETYIYIAIRRGPMKTPTSGTSVYTPQATADATNGTATANRYTSNFPIDLLMQGYKSGSSVNSFVVDRLRGASANGQYLVTSSTAAETLSDFFRFDDMDGAYGGSSASSSSTLCAWMFRRAPGFFDVVCYTGNGVTGRQITHNLGVAPEAVLIKIRNSSDDWYCGFSGSGWGNSDYLMLNRNYAKGNFGSINVFNNTAPTSSVFTVSPAGGGANNGGDTYVAYLFASCPGVSKVFSFTGNGSSQTINCGFTGGSRLVLIKRTDSTGNWVIFDSARGIVSGNDPALYLNSTAAEVTGVDAIDTDSTGFIVNQETTFNLNVNNATYIGLAIS